MDTHILNADTIMSNESDLYIVMPYCAGGDLCQRVAEKEELRFTEDESRFWFKQILKVSYFRNLYLGAEFSRT